MHGQQNVKLHFKLNSNSALSDFQLWRTSKKEKQTGTQLHLNFPTQIR